MTLQVLIAAVLAALVAGFGGGIWTHRKLDQAEAYATQQKAVAQARGDLNRIEHAGTSYVAGEVKAEERERVVIKEVIRVVSKPVYREQCLDDDGMRILSDDARASNARRGLEPAVPASGATNGSDQGRDASVEP